MKVIMVIPKETMELHNRRIEEIIADADESLGEIDKKTYIYYEYH